MAQQSDAVRIGRGFWKSPCLHHVQDGLEVVELTGERVVRELVELRKLGRRVPVDAVVGEVHVDRHEPSPNEVAAPLGVRAPVFEALEPVAEDHYRLVSVIVSHEPHVTVHRVAAGVLDSERNFAHRRSHGKTRR